MTNKKISQLTAGTPIDTDIIPYVDLVTGETKKALKSDLEGADGNGIDNIALINTVGLVKTYRITFTDASTFDYDVTDGTNGTNGTNGTDGNGIDNIALISTVGLVKTYRITYTDATTFDYTVTDGADGVSGTGDVNGPASAVDNNIATFDTTTGKLIQDGGSTIAQVKDRANHTGNQDLTSVTLTVPNSAAPVVNSDGNLAIDNSVSGLSHGILRYYSGEELFNLPLPVSNLSALNNGYIPKFNSTTQEFELAAENTGSGDTINNNINTIKKDSTSGTSDTYGVLTGAVNGVNTTYTTSTGIYVSGTLTVYRNGVRQVQGVSEDWVETTPGSGIFDFNTAPLTSDVIDIEYSNLEATADSIIVDKDITTISTNYTALISDRVVLVNASSGDITVTLPSTLDSVGICIKKVDTSGNIVTIGTPGAETIENVSSIDIVEPLQSKSIIFDGANYFVI